MSKWQPIETAPLFGNFILSDGERVTVGFRFQGWFYSDIDDEVIEATCWMPLPDPPKLAEACQERIEVEGR